MTSKNEKCFERSFESLISICNNYGYALLPKFIINDFEKAAINAVLEYEQYCFSI